MRAWLVYPAVASKKSDPPRALSSSDVPGSLAMIQGAFHPDDRARAIGTWTGLGAGA